MKIAVGVDLHKSQMTVFIKNLSKGMKGSYLRFKTNEAGYNEFAKILKQFEKEKDGDIEIAVESTGNTRYFVRQMEKHGYKVHIINTMKFKIINESVNKTDKHDAATLAEFLSKDLLPEVKLCSEESENIRNILKHRSTLKKAIVTLKNQVHGILCGLGIETKSGQLNSKRGRKKLIESISDPFKKMIVEDLIDSIEMYEEKVKKVEEKLLLITEKDETIKKLRSIPGCGFILSTTIRAYIDDINKFSSYKKLSAYAGLVPWVQNSAEKEKYGSITKRGPIELRTAFIQLAVSMIKVKSEKESRLLYSYGFMKKNKGSGKAIVALARKLSKIIWFILKNNSDYDPNKTRKTKNEIPKVA